MFQRSLRLSLTCSTFIAVLTLVTAAAGVQAQTTRFSYQGRLTDGSQPASGSYEMQFKLFDALTDGIQQPQAAPITLTFAGAQAISVTNGVFTVQLDFGAGAFPGADRYLEISVKKSADSTYTTLQPRQQITNSPYSIRTLSARFADALSSTCVSCVTDDQINSVAGSKVTGTVANATTATSAGNVTGVVALANGGTGSSTGDGSALINLNGSNITSGTIAEARLGLAGGIFSGRINGLSTSAFGGAILAQPMELRPRMLRSLTSGLYLPTDSAWLRICLSSSTPRRAWVLGAPSFCSLTAEPPPPSRVR